MRLRDVMEWFDYCGNIKKVKIRKKEKNSDSMHSSPKREVAARNLLFSNQKRQREPISCLFWRKLEETLVLQHRHYIWEPNKWMKEHSEWLFKTHWLWLTSSHNIIDTCSTVDDWLAFACCYWYYQKLELALVCIIWRHSIFPCLFYLWNSKDKHSICDDHMLYQLKENSDMHKLRNGVI